jgi:hypothetical protein
MKSNKEEHDAAKFGMAGNLTEKVNNKEKK